MSAILGLVVVAAGLAGCTHPPAPDVLERIRERGELRVATINGPTSYYVGAHGPEGLEFVLSRAFARELGVGLIYPVADERALRAELVSGRADLAAAQLTFGDAWRAAGRAVAPYGDSPHVVVYRKGGQRPVRLRSLERLRIAVEADSTQLRALRALRTAHPHLDWQETAGLAVEGPLAQLNAGKADVAVVDGHEFAFLSPVYPNLGIAMVLPLKRPVQWIVGRRAEGLQASAEAFFARLRASGELAQLLHGELTGDAQSVRLDTTREFSGHIEARLPSLQPLFEQASLETGLDWRLLAALGYQESQWNPRAESPNGAQGVMMLMADTAASLGVSDPWDARENIFAGARYITQMRDKIPARIPEPDRTWLALAAYNVGLGHLEDARVLTQMRGGNPDRWTEVRAQLPLLADEHWYSRLKRGYARGWEPVQFVDRIQQFLNVLVWRRGGGIVGIPTSTPAEQPGA
ncbi:MAG: membrane-bound lytic murein transglycosylase MltF [Gammaproteobacteria bacterium]|nr:membrane-bound lytic murein transglycosylase MltF [Gammaproteobacteria bacterium]